jgi:hypothetical protein
MATLFVFKLIYTDISHSYNIPSNWSVKYAFMRIRDYLASDFGVNNTFEFAHVDEMPQSYNQHSHIYLVSQTFLDSTDTIENHFNNAKPITFYIRHIECDNYEATNGSIERI